MRKVRRDLCFALFCNFASGTWRANSAMNFDWKHFVLSHLVWIIGVSVAVVAFYQWRGEHDARLKAEAQEKASQQIIDKNAKDIADLRQQITDNDNRAAQQVADIQKLVATVKTPAQVVKEIPVVAPTLPAAPVAQSDGSITFPKADVLPLFGQLADGASCKVQLVAAQKDLDAEKGIVAKQADDLKEKDKVIAGYKKAAGHHGFFGKVWGGVQKVGLLAIGVEIGKHL
jgi:hypothetical protein